jgi:hypothetical protein
MITSTSNLATIIGLVASIVAVLLGLGYLATILTSLIKGGMTFPPSEPVQLAGAIVSIGIGIDLVVLMVAIQWHLPTERQILAEIAMVFSALLCVSTSINRFVQLSVLPQYRQPENPLVLDLIHPYGSKSIMFAVESLGWGLFYGLGVLFAGLAFLGGSGLDPWISGLFLLGGVLSLLYALGVILKQPILSLLGFPAWSVLATVTAILLAIRFLSML